MRFLQTELSSACVIEIEKFSDSRGHFALNYSQEDFEQNGIPGTFVERNVSWNNHQGTLRGMHYQVEPFAQAKVVQCTRGAIYDVIIDLRVSSETYCKWIAVELTAENGKMLFVPEGFAHGFQTLAPDTEVTYLMGNVYMPSHGQAIRWNDPYFGIHWPLRDPILSDRDRIHPDFQTTLGSA